MLSRIIINNDTISFIFNSFNVSDKINPKGIALASNYKRTDFIAKPKSKFPTQSYLFRQLTINNEQITINF